MMQTRILLALVTGCLMGTLVQAAEDPAIIILKSSANFLPGTGLLPKKLESALMDESKARPKESTVNGVSVTTFTQAIGAPWDTIVYGKKRGSYTIFSYESWYPDAILDNVGALSPFVQWRLAAGILASNIVGDESLHVGHFFARTVSQKSEKILDLVRVDLNARERFAKARQEKNQQSPYHASSFYQKSGQYNKDYVSYILADKTLDLIYTMLWVNLASKGNVGEIIKKESGETFRKQLNDVFQQEINKVPEKYREKSVSDILGKKKEKAIQEILATLNKDATNPVAIDKLRAESSLADIVGELDAQRTTTMIKEATAKYDAYMNNLQAQVQKLKLSPNENLLRFNALRLTDNIIKRNKSEGDLKQTIDSFKDELIQFSCRAEDLTAQFPKCKTDVKPTPEFFNRIALDSKIALAYTEATYLIQDFPRASENDIHVLQTVIDLVEFATHVGSEDRRNAARDLINLVLRHPSTFAGALETNKVLTDRITLNKGVLVNTTNKAGERLIKKLIARHKDSRS